MVALVLLEVIRARDLPTEILASEDPTQTMPRRLGLSDAVEAQIRRYREEARKKRKILDDQARDLFRLVLRRPDSDEVFFQAGELLAGKDGPLRGPQRLYPRKALFALARRQVRSRIRSLFGREVGAFARAPFILEARGHFFLDMDPGGDACALVSGLCASILSRYLGRPVQVRHRPCQGLKGELCRWTAVVPEDAGKGDASEAPPGEGAGEEGREGRVDDASAEVNPAPSDG